MPATIRHWMSASPVMLAGATTAAVISPPTLVSRPPSPAYRTWFSITSWIAFCDVAVLLAQLRLGSLSRRRQRADADDRPVQRLAHERRGQAGRELGDLRHEGPGGLTREGPFDACHGQILGVPSKPGTGGTSYRHPR